MITRRMNDGVLEICDERQCVLLSIAETINDKTITISLTGQIKNEVAHELEDEIMAVLSVCSDIILDFSNVYYIASLALKSLLSIQLMVDEIEGATMKLVGVSSDVMETLKESGLSEILMIEG